MSSEFDLIRRHFTRPAKSAALGVGDDCALVQAPTGLALAVTTDMLCEGTHFLPGADAQLLGHKTLAVNLSDLAAMGADPRWCTLALALPDADESWIAAFARGFFALAERHGIELIGGDTTRGPRNLCVTAFGTLPKGYALRRDGAQAGDDLWVSGATGEAALGLAHLRGRIALEPAHRDACLARMHAPEPRIALGRRLRNVATAAIDISDGLAADVGHICERSKLAATIELAAVPRAPALAACTDEALAAACLLAGGDDYELAFTAPPDARDAVIAAGAAAGVAVTRIGAMAAGTGVTVRDAAGAPVRLAQTGYDHFK
jgi:thiamine-monophosphate kinase